MSETLAENINRCLADRTLPVVLVACCGPKLEQKAEAQELYTSDLFRKSRAWAERFGAWWFILSAKYGVVPPGKVIAPYDLTLSSMSWHERAVWNQKVREQWGTHDHRPVVLLAGANYREWCSGRGYRVPMEGLGIGRQLQWLKRELSDERSTAPT